MTDEPAPGNSFRMMDDIALPVEKAVDGPIARSTPLAAGAGCSPRQRRQALPLAALAIEILRVEPALERRFEGRPLAVDDRVPGGVAVAALVDQCLAKNPLEPESKALGGLARGRIERVAFPFVAAIAELVEGASHHPIHGLGRRAALLQPRRISDRSDFDRAHGRIDPHIARHSRRAPARAIDDDMAKRILAEKMRLHEIAKLLEARERAIGQVGPGPPLFVLGKGIEQLGTMPVRIEEFEPAKAAVDCVPWRPRPRLPVRHGKTDRLPQLIHMRVHGCSARDPGPASLPRSMLRVY